VAGLLKPTRGVLTLDGRPISKTRTRPGGGLSGFRAASVRRVLSNVELGAEIRGVPAAERHEIARRYIGMVGLREFEHRLSAPAFGRDATAGRHRSRVERRSGIAAHGRAVRRAPTRRFAPDGC